MPSTSTEISKEILGNFYSRRLLLHTPLYQQPATAAAPTPFTPTATITSNDASEGAYPGDKSVDAIVVMVLSVLFCALICSLGLNFIIRCALRCSNSLASESVNPSSSSSSSSTAARLAKTGIKEKALKTFPIVQYSEGLKLETECVICLAAFLPGERMRLLPKCNHGFHVLCIDIWLNSHSSCPTCRHCLVQTSQKIVGGCSSTSPETSQLPRPQQDHSILIMAPLQPEAMICNNHT